MDEREKPVACPLSNEWIEMYALRHIAPHASGFKKAFGLEVPYQQTEQFERVKAYTQSVCAALHAESRDAEVKALLEENANWQEAGRTMASEVTRLRERIAGMEKDAGMTYEQIAEKLSSDGYSKQADVIRQIVAKEKQDE